MKNKMKKNRALSVEKRGFTLIELMVAIAIIAILSAIILVSMQGYAKDARASKALAQLSGAIPSLMSCWGNGLTPNVPSSGGNICGSDNKYGIWPIAGSGELSSYSYASTLTDKGDWVVELSSGSTQDNKKICCNSKMNSCGIISGTCSADATW